MPLLLSDRDVRSLVTMRGAIDALATAFADRPPARLSRPWLNLMLPNGWIRVAAAALPARGILGL